MIGAWSVVTKSVPARAVVMGNPGRIVRYVNLGNELNRQPADTEGTSGSGKDTHVP